MGADAAIRVHTIFFHPDCTVGLGISPNPALRLVGYTTGGELHPALKILIQLRKVYAHLRPLSRGGPPEGGTSGRIQPMDVKTVKKVNVYMNKNEQAKSTIYRNSIKIKQNLA